MSDWPATAAVCAGVAAAGWPWATALMGERLPLLARAGIGFLAGAALSTLLMLAEAFAGLALTRAAVAGALAVCWAVGAALSWRRRGGPEAPRARPGRLLPALPPLALAAAALAVALAQAFRLGPDNNTDFLEAWGLKAIAVFREHDLSFAHLQTPHTFYPLLVSNLHAELYLLLGHVDDRTVHLLDACFGLALAASMWWLLRLVLPPAGAALGLALAVANEQFVGAMTNGLADLPVAAYTLVVVLAAYLWVRSDDVRYANLAGLAAGAAAWTKLEGGVTALVVLATAVILRRRLRDRGLAACLAWFCAFTVPWQVYRRLHHIASSPRHFSRLYLGVGWTLTHVARQLGGTGQWGLFWPLCLALVLLTLPSWLYGRERLLAALTLPNVALTLGAFFVNWNAGTIAMIENATDRLYLHLSPAVAALAAAGVTAAWTRLGASRSAAPAAVARAPRQRPSESWPSASP